MKENTSQFSEELNYQLNNIWGEGEWSWSYAFDCMMTTVCTGRPLPDGGNTAAKVYMNETIFNRTVAQIQAQEAYLNLYNNSEWSKLAMGNTAWHVRTNLLNAIYNASNTAHPPLKMALFSGHDTTIQPFLAAVLRKNWDGLWPGYASMVTIELYRSKASITTPSADPVDDFLFRMVYNSKVLLVPGCADTLCSASFLVQALSFGQEFMPCSVTTESQSNDDAGDNCDSPQMSHTDWTILAVLCTLLGGVVGASVVIFVEKRRQEKASESLHGLEYPLMKGSDQNPIHP